MHLGTPRQPLLALTIIGHNDITYVGQTVSIKYVSASSPKQLTRRARVRQSARHHCQGELTLPVALPGAVTTCKKCKENGGGKIGNWLVCCTCHQYMNPCTQKLYLNTNAYLQYSTFSWTHA